MNESSVASLQSKSKMSSNICEDGLLLNPSQEEAEEIRRKFNPTSRILQQIEEKCETSSTKSDIPEDMTINDNIIISPEDIPDEYEYNEQFPGLFLLFNHEEFATHRVRKGTEKDQNDLVDCLSRLRYEVRRDLLYKNYTKQQIEEELNKIVQMDHSNRSSLIVVFLTHGGEDGVLYSSDGDSITCQEIWNLFTAVNCPSLKGKPKIFIFQACKGEERSQVADAVQEDGICRVAIAKKNYTIPAEADILVAFSTFEGKVAFRHPLSGSWYIQELCKNFTAYGRRDDIVTIFTRISKCVAHHYQHKEFKQMPYFISTLTRKFYLSKSKERSHILDFQEQNKKLLETVQKLHEKVDVLVSKQEESKEDKTDKASETIKPFRKNSTIRRTSLSDRPKWK